VVDRFHPDGDATEGLEQPNLLGEPTEGDEQRMLGQDRRGVWYTHGWRSLLDLGFNYHPSSLSAFSFYCDIKPPPFARNLR
jgi:hypothetical protein